MDAFLESGSTLEKAAVLYFIVNNSAFQIHHAICAVCGDKDVAMNETKIQTVNTLYFNISRTQQRIDDWFDKCKMMYDLATFLPNLKGTIWGQINRCDNFRTTKLPDVIRLAGFDDSFYQKRIITEEKD